MELSGTKLLLILLAPLALIIILYVFIYPLHARLFDREKPLKNLLKDKRKQFKQDVNQTIKDLTSQAKEKGGQVSREQIEELDRELRTLRKKFLASSWETTKEIMKVHNEESGFSDLVKVRVDNSVFFYIASMLLTVIALPIVLGLSAYVLPKSAGRETYLFLAVLPIIGCWLGYKGYISQSQQKKTALILSIVVNVFYAIFLIYGILRLGK